MIGRNILDLVHPRDHCELQDVTGSRCLNSLHRSPITCNDRLLIRMRCPLKTKGHSLSSKLSAYRVRFSSSFLRFTRDSSNCSLPRLNTRVGERTFSYAGPAAWNQLPKSICQLQTTSFKHKLETFLFTQCYNSAD